MFLFGNDLLSRAAAQQLQAVLQRDVSVGGWHVTWSYPAELAEALGLFGLAPSGATPPALVRDALNELYRYELRRLRDDYVAKRIAKPDYLAHVVVLRKKYWPLTLQLPAWEKICRPTVSEPSSL